MIAGTRDLFQGVIETGDRRSEVRNACKRRVDVGSAGAVVTTSFASEGVVITDAGCRPEPLPELWATGKATTNAVGPASTPAGPRTSVGELRAATPPSA